MIDNLQLAQWLKAEAREYGFRLAGITSPAPPGHWEIYQQWLEAGRHGEMRYLASPRAREYRKDPSRLLPGCQSILVLAAPYLPATEPSNQKISRPRISTYALGEDYHEVLLERAGALLETFQNHLGHSFTFKIYTDTGPILERELAQRAGLGWIGKNTCLIHPRAGSFLFLVEVLLEIALPPDQPFSSERCGNCTRCIEACPTHCILPNRTLDATRCLSYLTIELKENIPLGLRRSIGDWAFGCDVCQQVCPWNIRFARSTVDPAFQPHAWLKETGLQALLQMGRQEFQEKASHSPLRRAKHIGFLRNLIVVAGNSGEQALLPLLVGLLRGSAEATLRAHAAPGGTRR